MIIKGYCYDKEEIAVLKIIVKRKTETHLITEIESKGGNSVTTAVFDKKLQFKTVDGKLVFLKEKDCIKHIKDLKKRKEKELGNLKKTLAMVLFKKRRF
jgi:hypothetical protein